MTVSEKAGTEGVDKAALDRDLGLSEIDKLMKEIEDLQKQMVVISTPEPVIRSKVRRVQASAQALAQALAHPTPELPIEAVLEAAAKFPVEAVEQVHTEVASEVPAELPVPAVAEVPVEAAVELPLESSPELPVDAVVEAAIEAALNIPVEVPGEASPDEASPSEASIDAEVEAAIEAALEMPVDSPSTVGEPSPVETAMEKNAQNQDINDFFKEIEGGESALLAETLAGLPARSDRDLALGAAEAGAVAAVDTSLEEAKANVPSLETSTVSEIKETQKIQETPNLPKVAKQMDNSKKENSSDNSLSMTVTGQMSLKLNFEYEGQEILIHFNTDLIHIQFSEGTEFKIPVKRSASKEAA